MHGIFCREYNQNTLSSLTRKDILQSQKLKLRLNPRYVSLEPRSSRIYIRTPVCRGLIGVESITDVIGGVVEANPVT